MPHDPTRLSPAPKLTADEVRNRSDLVVAEADKNKAKSYEEIRKSYALLKRVDEIMARR